MCKLPIRNGSAYKIYMCQTSKLPYTLFLYSDTIHNNRLDTCIAIAY